MEGNVPEIRLKGFTEPWVQRKLGEVAEFNPRSILPDSFEYVDLESVVGTELISHRTENKDTAPSRAQRLAKKGDVFFQMVRPYQMNNYLFDLPHENYVFSTGYAQLRPNIDSYFLLCLLQEKKFVAEVIDNCTGTSYPAINSTTLANIEIIISQDKEEQTSIGKFFRSLDETIILHKRKLDGLRELKKGYLQKMFPQTGETVPRIRFDGFTEPWHTRNANEIFCTVSNKGHVHLPVLSASQEHGMVLRDEIGIDIKFDTANMATYKRVQPGQFIIHLRSFQGGFAFSTVEGITSPAYTILDFANKENHVPEFWMDILKSDKFIKMLASVTYGIRDGRSISFNDFSMLQLSYPCRDEQAVIGKFFINLNNQITTQNQKVEQLKQLKAAYLQKMFV